MLSELGASRFKKKIDHKQKNRHSKIYSTIEPLFSLFRLKSTQDATLKKTKQKQKTGIIVFN